jgi:hypothetical protein
LRWEYLYLLTLCTSIAVTRVLDSHSINSQHTNALVNPAVSEYLAIELSIEATERLLATASAETTVISPKLDINVTVYVLTLYLDMPVINHTDWLLLQ